MGAKHPISGASQDDTGATQDQLVDGLALAGDAFLHWVVRWLETRHDAVFVTVAQLVGEMWQRARPIATRANRGAHDADEWDLSGTPCALPASGTPHAVASDLITHYPEDPELRVLQADSYVGVPLLDEAGRTLGHVAVLCQRPLNHEEVLRIQGDIHTFVPRLTEELRHRRLLEDFADVVTASTLRSDADPIADLLFRSVRAMRVRAGVVAVTNPTDIARCRTVSIVRDREQIPAIECTTRELTAEATRPGMAAAGDVSISPDSLLGECLLPLVPAACVSLPLLDAAGQSFGILTLLHSEDLGAGIEASPLLKVVSHRIASELERQKREHERRAAERHALENQRLESLGMLAGGVAHDFNNLLVGVLGNAELCLDVLPDTHPASERLQQIVRAANAAAGLCHQLLDYAGSRRSKLQPQPVDQIVESMSGLLTSICGHGITIDFQLASSPMRAMADSAQLRQLLLNLIRNSAEAMKTTGGRVVVRTQVRDVAAEEMFDPTGKLPIPAGQYIELEVQDDGPGIPSHVLPRICEPFFTTGTASHGLGLPAVEGILRVHQGGLVIQSKPGEGTRVLALVPLAEQGNRAAGDGLSRTSRGSGRILVVDDSDLVRDTTCGLLKAAGHAVTPAGSGAAAVRMAAEAIAEGAPFRAAVIDLVMPGQDGVDTADSIRQHQPDLPIVMVTGFAAEQLLQKANDVPGSILLTKPFRQAALLQAIDDAARGLG